MESHLKRELEVACTAVQICAILTKRLQKESLSPENSISKADWSPVTIGDFAVQALLTSVIHNEAAFSQDEFLAEESADALRENGTLLDQVWKLVQQTSPIFSEVRPSLTVPSTPTEVSDLIDLGGKNTRSDAPRTWVFDPIDGTQTFLQGRQYTINCAFLRNGIEEIGVIGCPNLAIKSSTVHEDETDSDGLGLMIFAVRGQGTWVRAMQPSGALLPATRVERHGEKATMDRLIWSDCSTYSSTILHLHQNIAAQLNCSWPGVDLYSSILKYASLGLGRSSIVMRIFKFVSWRSNMWDHAGGVLIFEEAGGKVTDLNGKAIDFSKGRKMSENYGLVCAPISVHAEVLRVVQDVLLAHGPIPWDRNSAV